MCQSSCPVVTRFSRVLGLCSLFGLISMIPVFPARAAESASIKQPSMPTVPGDNDLRFFPGFREALKPISASSPEAERRDLAAAVRAWLGRTNPDDFSTLEGFLEKYPNSAWAPSVRLNLASYYFDAGRYSLAMTGWKLAWTQTKDVQGVDAAEIANAAVAEYAVMLARVGRKQDVEEVLNAVATRTFQGRALVMIEQAREGLWNMINRPGIAFRCGPYALATINPETESGKVAEFLKRVSSPPEGFSFLELKGFAAEYLQVEMQVAKRAPGAALIYPSVIHWKLGHFAALVESKGGLSQVKDPTFGKAEHWITRAAIDDEGSGYFLVPAGQLPEGWMGVDAETAAEVRGKGHSGNSDTDETTSCSKMTGSDCNTKMAGYTFHTLLASLRISDVPMIHDVAKGPGIEFKVAYNMKEATQPSTMLYSNFSPQWTHSWVSYLEDNPGGSSDVRVFLRGGGAESHFSYDAGTGEYATNRRWNSRLVKLPGGNSYERRFPDGSKEVFGLALGISGPARKIFLTKVVDPSGLEVTLGYDSNPLYPSRLKTITDASGLVTTLGYDDSYPYLVRSATDAFLRTATFLYAMESGAMRLKTITDTLGLQSTFVYDANGQITSLTTPYGVTNFSFGSPNTAYGLIRWIQATDPEANTERIEYHLGTNVTGVPGNLPPEDIPSSAGLPIPFTNGDMDDRNTFYWSKKAWAMHPGDYSKAHLYHWLQIDNADFASGILESEKPAHEGRIWYQYPGQTNTFNIGTSPLPSAIVRIVETGHGPTTTRVDKFTYNGAGNVTSHIDPAGRETFTEYDSGGIDVLAVKQRVGGVYKKVGSYEYGSPAPPRRPKSVYDEANKKTELTYTPAGQISTLKNALGETTTFNYFPNGRLENIVGPGSVNLLTHAYDSMQRLRTATDASGYAVTYDRDAFDRVTKITYPDSTTEELRYTKLDVSARKDREGRWTQTSYNSIRQPEWTTDSEGRTTRYEWCKCGKLQKLTDALKRVTAWKWDAQGRMMEKSYPDGRKEIFSYELMSGRLARIRDAKGQIKAYSYNVDGTQKGFSYPNAAVPTPAVGFTYDPDIQRVVSMTDGTGTTSYSYFPLESTGGARVSAINGPLAGDTDLIGYTYDDLGRGKTANIGPLGSENLAEVGYDSLGRVTSSVNNLGSFGLTYAGSSGRVDYMTYPNGMTADYDYFGATGDFRLKTINNKLTSGSTVYSRFDYEYTPAGNIKTWTKQLSNVLADATKLTLGYDRTDQLLSATEALASTPSSVSARHSYRYDPAGNRTSVQKNNEVTSATFNRANQIVATTGGGKLRVAGATDEPAKVEVNGQQASVSAGNLYEAWVDVALGPNDLTVKATDYATPTVNESIHAWRVNVTGGTPRKFTYDANGNTLSDGIRTCQWDAEDRLVKITQGGKTYEFIYDGLSRRVAEKVDGVLNRRWIWDGTKIAEQRDAVGTDVTRRYYPEGEQRVGGADAGLYYYTRDHLGSIREMTDSTAKVRAKYDYDPYGLRSARLADDLDCEWGFTGHFHHVGSGLNLALYRAYDPSLGRWLSPDPIGEGGGTNLYAYCRNNFLNLYDPDGLVAVPPVVGGVLAYVGANGGLGATVGAVGGAIGGYMFGCDGHKGSALLAGAISGGIGGGIGGVGSAASTDFAGPGSFVGDFISGYLSVKATFAIGDMLDPCPGKISPERQKLRDGLAILTGVVAMLPLTDQGDAIVIGLATGLGTTAIDWLGARF